MKSGFVAVIGRPNVGKSTLINLIINHKISIISEKPQTTRNQIQAIYNDLDSQIVFLDTPGYHQPKNKLDSHMNLQAMNSTKDVEIILYLSDSSRHFDQEEEMILKNIKERKGIKILVITKADLVQSAEIEKKVSLIQSTNDFSKVLIISKELPQSIFQLVNVIKTFLPEGQSYFPKDQMSNVSDVFQISEIIREKALHNLKQEIPHALTVQIEKHVYDLEKKLYTIKAAVIVEKESHKKIVIGSGGSMIKKIGMAAREELEKIYDAKIYLELFVKVEKDWRNNEQRISEYLKET